MPIVSPYPSSPPSETQAWGKLDRSAPDAASAPRLTLVAHCIDVAAVMDALLSQTTLQRRLAALAGRPLDELDRRRLVALAFLHDVGKAGAGFQSRGMAEPIRAAWQDRNRADPADMGHIDVVAPLFEADGCEAHRQAIGFERVLDWGGDSIARRTAVCDLWLAALSHHGEPVTLSALRRHSARRWPTWHCAIGDYVPLRGLTQLGHAARTLFPEAFGDAPFGAFQPALVHAYAGLVSLADWIGSNTDEQFFPYDFAPQTLERWRPAQQRARHVLRLMCLDAEAVRTGLQEQPREFSEVFGVPPRDLQRRAAAWDGERDGNRTVVLEAETGSGKTEAALWRFKTLFEAGEVDALCFLLPTRVASTGIYRRLQHFIETLFPDPALRPPTVLAVPGYLRANGEDGAKALAGYDVLWADGAPSLARPLYWAAENSKRYFAACTLAGTIDQFLLSALQVRHAHLRGSLALRSLIVVDEVHASDAYMTALLRAALERHVRAGGHALLMSATLTGDARTRLLEAGSTRRPGPPRVPAGVSEIDAPYPAVSTCAGIQACAPTGRNKNVEIALQPWARDAAAVAALAARELAQGARVMVLRNTVRQAVETQRALESLLGTGHPALFSLNGVAALHHGRYAFEDRQRLDEQVERHFGKGSAESVAPRVLVGTQTLEISVDCDSDVMITDLAPIDVLLQRLGRLHRHPARDPFRAEQARRPRLMALTPAERDLGQLLLSGSARGLGIGPRSPYENLLVIEATWRLLEEASGCIGLQIPHDNRRLVESGAGMPALRSLAELLGEPWLTHFNTVYGKQSAQASQALPILMRWDKPWGDGGWSELGDEVRTRLGLENVDLDLLRPWTTPLGGRITRLSAPAWLLQDGDAPRSVSEQIDDGPALRLIVGRTSLVYDRWGLSRASDTAL